MESVPTRLAGCRANAGQTFTSAPSGYKIPCAVVRWSWKVIVLRTCCPVFDPWLGGARAHRGVRTMPIWIQRQTRAAHNSQWEPI